MRGAALALERASGMGMAQRSSTRITCGPGRHLRVREKGNIRVRERRAISESEREGQYPSQREKGNIRVRGSTCSKACNSGATRHFSRDIPPPPTRKASRKVASDARPPCRGQLLSRSRRASLGGLDPHAAGCRRPGPNWPGPSGPRPGRWGVAEAATLELQVHGGRPCDLGAAGARGPSPRVPGAGSRGPLLSPCQANRTGPLPAARGPHGRHARCC